MAEPPQVLGGALPVEAHGPGFKSGLTRLGGLLTLVQPPLLPARSDARTGQRRSEAEDCGPQHSTQHPTEGAGASASLLIPVM